MNNMFVAEKYFGSSKVLLIYQLIVESRVWRRTFYLTLCISCVVREVRFSNVEPN